METEELKYHPDDMSEKDFSQFANFLDTDIMKSQDVRILHRNKDFSEGEAIVLYPDYLFIRHKDIKKNKIKCESLAMEKEHESVSDVSQSIIRESIIAISVFRQSICDCEECAAKIVKGGEAEQPDGYFVEISTSSRPYFLIGGDKDFAFWLQEHLMQWRFKKGPFRNKNGMFIPSKKKSKKK